LAKPQQTKIKYNHTKESGDKHDDAHSGVPDEDGTSEVVVMTIETGLTKEGRGTKEGGDKETDEATKEANVEVKEAGGVGILTVVFEK
jgi:hypothetical protein